MKKTAQVGRFRVLKGVVPQVGEEAHPADEVEGFSWRQGGFYPAEEGFSFS